MSIPLQRRSMAALAVLAGLTLGAAAQNPAPSADETSAEHDARMQWWREAKFGMFIHWGVYAVPAGEWAERKNHGEWIRETAKIPMDVYAGFLDEFNPVQYNPEQWVLAAKGAGMKYIVITSKHHDGFCLWPSKLTDYDIESTPYKRDLLGPLKEACDKHGMKLGFYYSIMDWHHPNYPPRGWEKDRPREQIDMEKYVVYMKGQLKELIESYDPVVLWFDGEWDAWTKQQGADLYAYVRSLKPDIIVNNRVGKRTRELGDFGTPEQSIPSRGMPGWDWETCMTMNNHWGWNKADKGWKSADSLVERLVDIVSKGGNFLLNVGPKPDGTFPDEALERLADIGTWTSRNGEAIYGTTANPVGPVSWGRVTAKKGAEESRLYLHVMKRPADGALLLPGLRNTVKGARLLHGGHKLEARSGDMGLTVTLPEDVVQPPVTVAELSIEGAPKVVKPAIQPDDDGVLTAPAALAEIRAPDRVSPPQISGEGDNAYVSHWHAPSASVTWPIEVKQPGVYEVAVVVSAEQEGAYMDVGVDYTSVQTQTSVPDTGDYNTYTTVHVGPLNLSYPGRLTLSVTPRAEGWTPVNIRRVILTPTFGAMDGGDS